MIIVRMGEYLGDLYIYHEGYEKYAQPLNNTHSIGQTSAGTIQRPVCKLPQAEVQPLLARFDASQDFPDAVEILRARFKKFAPRRDVRLECSGVSWLYEVSRPHFANSEDGGTNESMTSKGGYGNFIE